MSTLFRLIESVFRAREAATEVSELMDLSDDALTRRGLTRDKIVAHVFAEVAR